METVSLIRHYQTVSTSELQGWHPHNIVRWLFFALPLLYFILIECNVFKRLQWLRQRQWVSTQARTLHFKILFGVFELFTVFCGIYAAIADAWSTKEWVLWTSVLVFGGLTMLAYSTHHSCGVNIGLIIATILSITTFFFAEWLFAQTRDMNQNIWKHLVRNFWGFNTALLMFIALTFISRVLVYVFGLSQSHQAKFFWVVGILASIGFSVLNILAYGPFICVIGFIIGCIVCLIVAYLFDTHEVKDILLRQ